MQVKPVSPPNGSELLVLNKDGRTLYVTRPQVAAILAFTGVRSRPFPNLLTERTGQERYRAIQGGVLVEFSLADFTAYLAGTATPDPVPFGRGLDVYSGTERFVGRQGTGLIASDIMQTLYVRGLGGSLAGLGGDILDNPLPPPVQTPTPTPTTTLNALLLSSTSFLTGGVTSVGITGKTAGSSIAATSSDGTTLSVSGSTLSGTFTAAGSRNITLVETLAGATNSGRQSVVGVTITVPGAALSISGTQSTATVGDTTAFTPTIAGGTAPYTLSLASGTMAPGRGISGLSVTGTFTTAGTYSYTLRVTDSVGATATLAVGPLVVSAAAAATERVATFGTSIPTLSTNRKAGRLQTCTRKTIVFGADVPYIIGSFDNFATQPSGDTPAGASITILQHAYIKPDGTGSKIVTFDNGASTTKVLGTTAATGIRVFHDKVYPADIYGAGVTMFRRGDRITLQTDKLISDDQTTADALYNCETATGDNVIEFTATGVPVAVGVGTIPTQTNQVSSGTGYTVSCVYGPHSDTAHINFGDSISAGTGDSPVAPIRTGYSRAGTNSYFKNPVPLVNLARHGTVMNDLFNTDLTIKSTGVMRMAYVASGTFQQVSENWAANDLGQSSAQSTYNLTVANKARLYQILRARGCQWITTVAPTPRTTNGTTNTPVNAGWAKGGQADQLNQWLEARVTDGTINAVVRSVNLRASSDPTNDGYFIYRTTDYTVDGTHLQPAGYVAVMAEHRFAVLRGNVANDEPNLTIGRTVLDTFTTGVGASIADRPTDTGQNWTRQGAADWWVTAEGRAYAKQNGYLYMKTAAVGKDQWAERDTTVVSANTGAQHLFLRRQDDPVNSAGYIFSFFPNSLYAGISRINSAGVSTALPGTTLATDPGTQYTMRAEARGPYLNFYMGPIGGPLALVASAVDAIYQVGDVCVRDTNNATATAARHTDEFRAGNLPAFTGA